MRRVLLASTVLLACAGCGKSPAASGSAANSPTNPFPVLTPAPGHGLVTVDDVRVPVPAFTQKLVPAPGQTVVQTTVTHQVVTEQVAKPPPGALLPRAAEAVPPAAPPAR